jgi:hypothetical protein
MDVLWSVTGDALSLGSIVLLLFAWNWRLVTAVIFFSLPYGSSIRSRSKTWSFVSFMLSSPWLHISQVDIEAGFYILYLKISSSPDGLVGWLNLVFRLNLVVRIVLMVQSKHNYTCFFWRIYHGHRSMLGNTSLFHSDMFSAYKLLKKFNCSLILLLCSWFIYLI